jgi:phenylacetate-CoA ligase
MFDNLLIMIKQLVTKLFIATFNRNFFIALNNTLTNQWLHKNDLLTLQEEKFFKLISHCRQNVPYYRNLKCFEKIQSISDICEIPYLTKNIINRDREAFCAENIPFRRFKLMGTSGSTGEKLTFYSDKKNHLAWACTIRGDMWAGYQLGDKQLLLWNIDENPSVINRLGNWLKNWLIHHRTIISAKELSDIQLKGHLSKFNKVKPDFVIGYPGSLAIFASFIEKHGYKVHKPKGIISASDTLFEHQRKKIESVFNCKVLNRYGSTEVFHIAGECEHQNGLHISTDHIILEVVNDKGEICKPGEMGEIIVTDLTNYAFPFIRYKTGDLGRVSDKNCVCGRQLPILENIYGRVTSITVGLNGVKTSGIFWIELLQGKIEGIKKFEIIQKSIDSIDIKIVPETIYKKSDNIKITNLVKDKFGQGTNVNIIFEKQLSLSVGGKHQFIYSNVSPYI